MEEFSRLIAEGQAAEAVTLYQGDFLAGFTLSDCPDFDNWPQQHAEENELKTSGNPESAYNRERSKQNLPPQPTSFIGRVNELSAIRQLLTEEVDCRLLTLIGAGGNGKTRVAIEAAMGLLDRFEDGTFLVALASLKAAEHIVPTIAASLQFTFQGSDEPETQLLTYLYTKNLLLIVDNLEHLLVVGELLSRLIMRAPQIKILATSRAALGLQEEWLYPIGGLSLPDADLIEAEIEHQEAVQLFVQRARRVNASFGLTDNNRHAVAEICRLVDGIPLGIELAAAWVRTMSCLEIRDEIQRDLDFLVTSFRNVPERHRSLRAIFQQTWQQLSELERTVLVGLSIFRGGCTREAAQEVTNATLSVLSALVDKGLLRRDYGGRYEMHELLRQFAGKYGEALPHVHQQIQEQYYGYYSAFLHHCLEEITCSRQKEVVTNITKEIDNVRACWDQAVTKRDTMTLEKGAITLFIYSLHRAAFHECSVSYQQALRRIKDSPEHTIAPSISHAENFHFADVALNDQALVGLLLAGQGVCLARTSDPLTGVALAQQGVDYLRSIPHRDRYKEAWALFFLAASFSFWGKSDDAVICGQESLALFTELEEDWGCATCVLLLGVSAWKLGHYQEADDYLAQGLRFCQKIGELRLLAYFRHNLGYLAIERGLYTEAKEILDAAMNFHREYDDLLGTALSLQMLGRLASAQGSYALAQQYMQKGMSNYQMMNNYWAIVDISMDFANIQRLQGDFAGAKQTYLQVKDESSTSHTYGDKRRIASCLSGLGCLAFDEQQYNDAESFLQEALTVWRSLEHEPEIASTLAGDRRKNHPTTCTCPWLTYFRGLLLLRKQ